MKEIAESLLKHKDENVRKLSEAYLKILQKPEYESYISLLTQYTNWTKQYQDNKINLFKADDKPIFEIAHKFFTEMKPYIDLLSLLQTKLTTEEVEKAKTAASSYERALQRHGVLDE
jgi:Zn-dependent M16 (insulinase) family peptidase